MSDKIRVITRTQSHKAQIATASYVLLIALVVGGALYMQNYLKRGTQGQLQVAGDQIGDQYALGLTTSNEHAVGKTFFIEIRTAGLNNPTRITFTAGSHSSIETRRLRPLNEAWPEQTNR